MLRQLKYRPGELLHSDNLWKLHDLFARVGHSPFARLPTRLDFWLLKTTDIPCYRLREFDSHSHASCMDALDDSADSVSTTVA